MKFHCDRCKTRYSISEERVRGKILKIRCKNCAAVITVREGMEAGPPARGSSRAQSISAAPPFEVTPARPGALAGAFAEALSRPASPSAADSLSNAPASLDAEWYVSVDGEQEGPLTLEAARRWVAARAADEELYCWSEGFDEWLAIDKVSHFRGLRGSERADSDSGFEEERTVIDPRAALDGAAPAEDTPKPLFAATMAAVEANAPTVTEDERLPDPLFKAPNFKDLRPAGKSGPGGDDGSLDFDIGEASRVVKLPLLAQGLGTNGVAPVARPAAVLPGPPTPAVGGELAADPAMITAGGESGRPEVLQPRKLPQRGVLLPLVAAGALLVGGAVVVLLTVGGGEDTGGNSIARGSVGGGGNLGFTFRDEARRESGEVEAAEVEQETQRPGRARRTATRSRVERPTRSRSQSGSSVGFEEVDLSGGGSSGGASPLDGEDLMKVYRANQYLVKRCYERALKKDPFLEVSKTWVSISVAKDGRVTKVSIPNLRGTELGGCLTSIIKRWRFRESSEVFNSRFPVVFGS